jgi:hypothetical protein
MAIAPAPTDPAAVFRQLEARMQEHVEQRRHETLAREAEAAYTRRDLTPEQRRAMAFFAVHGLHGMWEVGRRAAGLCQARDLLRRVERELGFANDRTIADRLRRETEAALQETGLRNPCAPARATPAQRLPLAAAAPPPAAQPPAPMVVPAPPPAAVPQDIVPEPETPALLASKEDRQPLVAEGAEPLDSAPAIPTPDRRRREPLPPSHIAGATLLFAAGTAGWVGVGVLLREATKVDDAVGSIKVKMEAEGRTMATATEIMQFNRYIDQHERLTAGAAAIGTLAGLATLGGVLLVAIRPRPSSRMAARPWGSPWSAGVSLSGSF